MYMIPLNTIFIAYANVILNAKYRQLRQKAKVETQFGIFHVHDARIYKTPPSPHFSNPKLRNKKNHYYKYKTGHIFI